MYVIFIYRASTRCRKYDLNARAHALAVTTAGSAVIVCIGIWRESGNQFWPTFNCNAGNVTKLPKRLFQIGTRTQIANGVRVNT